jgi:hypothetical protein
MGININTIVSNHFHSVKNFLFSSAKPRDFDGMLGTWLSMSIVPSFSYHEMLGRLLPVFTLLLWQRQHIIVVDAVDYK